MKFTHFLFKFILCVFLIIVSCATLAYVPNKVVRVGVATDSQPFSFLEKGVYSGVAVEIFEKAAKEQGWRYQLKPMSSNIDDGIQALTRGDIDVFVGDVSITYPRSLKIDYSLPYFLNKIGLVVGKKSLSFMDSVRFYLSLRAFSILVALFIVLFVASHFYWYAERDENKNVHHSYIKGIPSVMFNMVYNVLGGGAIMAPISRLGHFIASLWLFYLFFTVMLFSASLTSSLTLEKIQKRGDFMSVADLKNKTIVTVKGRYASLLAKDYSRHVVEVKDMRTAIKMVQAGKADAFMDDYNISNEVMKTFEDPNLFMSSLVVKYDLYGFALQAGSPYLKAFNQAILKFQSTGESYRICNGFLGKAEAVNCAL